MVTGAYRGSGAVGQDGLPHRGRNKCHALVVGVSPFHPQSFHGRRCNSRFRTPASLCFSLRRKPLRKRVFAGRCDDPQSSKSNTSFAVSVAKPLPAEGAARSLFDSLGDFAPAAMSLPRSLFSSSYLIAGPISIHVFGRGEPTNRAGNYQFSLPIAMYASRNYAHFPTGEQGVGLRPAVRPR